MLNVVVCLLNLSILLLISFNDGSNYCWSFIFYCHESALFYFNMTRTCSLHAVNNTWSQIFARYCKWSSNYFVFADTGSVCRDGSWSSQTVFGTGQLAFSRRQALRRRSRSRMHSHRQPQRTKTALQSSRLGNFFL